VSRPARAPDRGDVAHGAPIRRPRRLAECPDGCWPRRMRAEYAAGYVGEKTVAAFVRRVRCGEYPAPVVNCGRRRLWLKDDLDRAIAVEHAPRMQDAAEDL
jgi:hypothetical protein